MRYGKNTEDRGIMAEMLKKCFNDMHEKKQPFTYLMPANKAYYEPFQFTFVMDWEETMIDVITILYTQMNTTDRNHKMQELLQYQKKIMNDPHFLEQFMQPYQIYRIPDKQYLRRLSKRKPEWRWRLYGYIMRETI